MVRHPAVERVVAYARDRGAELEVRTFPEGTRTADDAARAIGCPVAQIVKSLVFLADGDAVVVLVSGVDRVDEARVRTAARFTSVRRATANEVRQRTGFVVGGVPPFGHTPAARVIVDRGLLVHDVVWAAAGLPDAVFPIAPHDLVRLSGARQADVRVA